MRTDYSPEGEKRFEEFLNQKRKEISELNESPEYKKTLLGKVDALERKYISSKINFINSEIRKERIKRGLEKPNCYEIFAEAIRKIKEAGNKILWANALGALYFKAVQKDEKGFEFYYRN